jgi:ABC-type glycerol-3-phosphate transport system substrate-binding protein
MIKDIKMNFKLISATSLVLVSLLSTSCRGAEGSALKDDGANDHGNSDYTCALISSNSSIQEDPLFEEYFAFSATDTDVNKVVGVTSPGDQIIATISREENSVGKRINMQIYNATTEGRALGQFAEGAGNPLLMYSKTGVDTITLYCGKD